MSAIQEPVGEKPADSGWQVPEPLSTYDVRVDEHTVTKVRRYGLVSGGPRIIMTHGNGLASDVYYPFWSQFTDEFEVIVFDLRNHGWNEVGDQRDHNTPTLVSDLDIVTETVNRVYGPKATIGIFHSLSSLLALLSFSKLYTAMVLFDPPLCEPAKSQDELLATFERRARQVGRRAFEFDSEQQYAELLTHSPMWSHISFEICELAARTTLRKNEDRQKYQLTCPREYEAQIVRYVGSFAPLLSLSMLRCPTKIIGADPTIPFTYIPTFSLTDIMAVDYDFVPEAAHFLQLEQPEACARMVKEFAAERGIL